MRHSARRSCRHFDLFGGKCAYCESAPRDTSSGDVEHFRPKRGVTGEPDHPGYYWLAYDFTNFLPSCELCNRAAGKRNYFPVKGQRVVVPGPVDQEEPLLINPLLENPGRHLEFTKLGTVGGRTPEGKTSEEIYDLNRSQLVTARANDWAVVLREFLLLVATQGWQVASDQMSEKLTRPECERSASKLSQLNQAREELVNSLSDLPPG